jgi:hypothetical protein
MSSHAAIAESLANLYQLLEAMGYIRSDEFKLAPHPEFTEVREVLIGLDLNDNAVNLVEQIPWAVGYFKVVQDTPTVLWRDLESVRTSRHPTNIEDPPEELDADYFLPPHMIAIGTGYPDWGCGLVINVDEGESTIAEKNTANIASGTIAQWAHDCGLDDLTWMDARTYLDNLHNTYSRLDKIPCCSEIRLAQSWDPVSYVTILVQISQLTSSAVRDTHLSKDKRDIY